MMTKYFKRQAVAVTFILVAATLLVLLSSCQKLSDNGEEKTEDISHDNEAVGGMKNTIMKVARNVEKEKIFVSESDTSLLYDDFMKELEHDFDELEQEFSSFYLSVDSAEAEQLRALYEDLMRYHFMMLEVRLSMETFSVIMDDLLIYMTEGNMPTIEYNQNLDDVMKRYGNLLDEEVLEGINFSLETESKEFAEINDALEQAKAEIQNIQTDNDVDSSFNVMLYNLFNSMQIGTHAIIQYQREATDYDYPTGKNRLEEEPLKFTEEVLNIIWP